MKWKRWRPIDAFPNASKYLFLVTDNEKVYCVYHADDELIFVSDITEHPSDLEARITHWGDIQDTPLPNYKRIK